jgi:hypothetical protein
MVLIVLAHWLLLSVLLWSPAIEWNYPFMGGDGYDYLCNGLFYRGFDVPFSVRPPVLPLLVAAFDWAGWLSLLPGVVLLAHHLAVLALYRLMGAWVQKWWALLLAVGFLVSDASLFHGLTLEGVGLGTSLLFLAFFCFVEKRPVLAGGLAGASFATHQLALLFPVAVVVSLLLQGGLRSRAHEIVTTIGRVAIGFVPFAVAYWWLRMRALGTLGDGNLRHWSLLGLHFDGVATYAVFLVSSAGLPLTMLAGYGALRLLRNGSLKGGRHLPLLLVLPVLVLLFFVFAYDYNSRRFVSYLMPFVFLLGAAALAQVSSRIALPVMALVVLTAATPTSIGSQQKVTVALAPGAVFDLPITTDGTGSARVVTDRLGAVSLRRPYRSLYRQALVEWRRSPAEGRRLDGFPALYLFPEGRRPELYALQTRLSARFRTMVRSAPLAVFRRLDADDQLTPLETVDGLSVFAFESAELTRPWCLLVPEGSRLEPALSSAVRSSDSAEGLKGPVVVLAERPEAVPAWLLFELPPETLYTIGEERTSTLDFLGQFGCQKPVDSDDFSAWLCQVYDRTWTVLDYSQVSLAR